MSNKTSDKNVANIEELIQEYKTYNDLDGIQDLSIYVNALENILAEREQKDKRIKELEEENAILKKASNIAKDVNIEDVTEVMNKSFEEFMNNYINKQVVIDKINENSNIIKEIEEKIKEEENSRDICREYIRDLNRQKGLVKRDILTLQELLEGERK